MTRLRPHQVEPTQRILDLLRNVNSAIDLSDTGTGKTYVACAAAKLLNLPTLVVCPKIAIHAWRKVANHFNDTLSVTNYEALRTGRSPYGRWDNTPPPGFELPKFFVCQSCQQVVDFDNYRPCYCHRAGFHCVIEKKRKWKYGGFNFNPAVKLVVFDEAHRCGEIDTLNAKMMKAAHSKKVLALSATAATTPLKMQALGYTMGLHNWADFYNWAARHGCRRDSAGHFRWMVGADEQTAVMAKVHARLMERGVRVRTQDIPGFPARVIDTELVDLGENSYELQRALEAMKDALDVLIGRMAGDIDTPLSTILRARQRVELLKVPAAVEKTHDLLACGRSVVVFVNFQQTLNELRDRLKTDCIIDGSREGVRYRERNIDNFQANRARVMIANSEAGGISVSLQDLLGDFPRAGIVFPSHSAVTFRQVMGRLPREGGKSTAYYKVLLAANTYDEKVKKSLDAKLDNLDTLNDGDLIPVYN